MQFRGEKQEGCKNGGISVVVGKYNVVLFNVYVLQPG